MSALVQLLGELAAATPVPSPRPTADPALPAVVKIGPAGEWFGPTVLAVVSLIVDASAAGKKAVNRDTAAALLTYAATLGFVAVYGWSETIQGWFSDSWSWQLAGSGLSLLAHLAFAAVIIGDRWELTKRLSAWLGPKFGAGSADSGAVGRLNTKWHLFAVIAASSYVLARGDASFIPHGIGKIITWAGALVVTWVIDRLGGGG